MNLDCLVQVFVGFELGLLQNHGRQSFCLFTWNIEPTKAGGVYVFVVHPVD